MKFRIATALTVTALAAGGATSTAWAQGSSEATVASSGLPQRDTLTRMLKPVTVEFKEHRLEEVVRFIAELTGADIEPMWIDDANPQGLDKDKLITLKANGISALKLVERVLEKAGDEGGDAWPNTWQMSEGGALQIGPKTRLNKFKRLEIYDIKDLLMIVPEFANAPQFDLNSVLQSGGSGGSSQSPFKENNTGNRTGANGQSTIGNADIRPVKDRTDDLIKLIEEQIEADQWASGGGTGGSIRPYPVDFPNSIIVNASDYLHRQIAGYPYWPQRLTSYGTVGGRRYVSLNGNASINKLDGFGAAPITATAGGPPGGGR